MTKTKKNKYDIDISLSFLKDRINRLNDGIFKNDSEKTYNETVDFVFNLNKLRKEETIFLLDEIVIESNEIEIKTKSNHNEDIKCSYGYISKDKLKSLLKDITKTSDIPVKKKK